VNANTNDRQPHWALVARRLPARLVSEDAAVLLGFKSHDIPILVRVGLLKPLGGGPRNCVKYFSSKLIMSLMDDEPWVNKASKAVLRGRIVRPSRQAAISDG